MPVLSLAFLALAVSIDGFGVGVTYGLRKIRIPFVSIAIISLCSGVVIFVSMQIGVLIARFLSPSVASAFGAVILIAIGLWAIAQVWRQRSDAHAGDGEPNVGNTGDTGASASTEESSPIRTVLRIEMRRIGLVIEILRTPSLADVDRSGYISASEAMLLGVALSLDAFGAGIGAAFIGFAPLTTAAVIALASGLFIATGLKVGLSFAHINWLQRLSVLPGCILIVMGLMKLM